ncbi:urea carboxylase [Rhodoblastus acidophilus]|uniref:Urea carboxylase n=1 Tax=Candidatus Rhodoblastus alkanivorans TaxID=2954117 RepID=A0ABS9ZBS6_9HYPH|nr:urea carboxylase [Candidatus Rhodoblastus alkanivorans]MCI4677869.1 urea carboxylase [Candidatus Rhodoblastus alkanivorans]MCI4684632.1 urea carboxylase [Candidatus Rhodoblastus alkanivorans]MDI4641954.1 urea carboxylase [Rhodoblastus acidophilus]
MFDKVLIANRGEIVGRIARSLRKMGVKSVAVYSDADRFARPVLDADEAVRIGPAPASESYLRIDAVLDACRKTGAQAVHPGYGFLSENVGFAERLAAEGIAFIGPRPEHLRAFGLKHTAREIAQGAGVPLLPGSGLIDNVEQALAEAERISYPVMLKSTAGGGGIGMQLCEGPESLREKFESVQRTAKAGFGDARLYLERFVARARHVEVQIFGDGKGRVVALGERDCSLQRRNQKVIEETPPSGLSDDIRRRLREAAIALGRQVNYESAGTVEFIYDVARQDFSFLEVNTRLQVEHPVTEAIFGVDLVEWMIRQAAGEDVLAGAENLAPQGAAMEVRIYAENPSAGFRPSAGLLTQVEFPANARVDSWIETGAEVTANYDPMLAKVIVHGATRDEALAKLRAALATTRIAGIETNLAYLRAIAASDVFARGDVATNVLAHFAFAPRSLDVLSPGAQSTVQELPGRLGLWDVGVPPSGPMDEMSFRLANRIVGNAETVTALEMTARGASLRFNSDAVFALAGARMKATLDGVEVENHLPHQAKAGQALALGAVEGPGLRTYLALRGGFDAPEFLGSRATFTLGGFGGHAVGALKAGDVLHFGDAPAISAPRPAASEELPPLTHDWRLSVIYGPHGAPDFFLDEDISTLFSAEYEVHFNSARTGVRLTGPKPAWARADGGEAGLHPSNIHDNAYAIGAVDFTGDMPILLGPDGPSLGGFVCPAVTAREDLWKLGQLKPGDKLRFVAVERAQDPIAGPTVKAAQGSAILGKVEGEIPAVYRRAGDDNLLIEYGPMTLDIGLRMRVHLLAQKVREAKLPGLIDMTPGIRSLQIHYDSAVLPRGILLDALREIESALPSTEQMIVPSRIVHLPLSWNDPQAQLAMRKYQELVRPNAPWCPSNIEFIRRINGLDDEAAVRNIIFDANYLVLGLGDVYLGAPVATPVDPRHRLVTTKYNPARTWTPENAVGIGGAYMCVYGMEGPGGYQLFGRTIQMWNSWRSTKEFAPGAPWLLRFFDQIKFFPVSAEELLEARAAFPHGAFPLKIEETQFSYAGYKAFLAREAQGIAAFKTCQQAAFEAERQRWRDAKIDEAPLDDAAAALGSGGEVPDGCIGQFTEAPGNVWQWRVAEGDHVEIGQVLVVIESMKMEISIAATARGIVRSLLVKPGQTLRAGDLVCALEEV